MECTVSWTGATGARSGMGFVAETGSGDKKKPGKWVRAYVKARQEMVGLLAAVDSGTVAPTYAGLTRSTNPQKLGGIFVNGATLAPVSSQSVPSDWPAMRRAAARTAQWLQFDAATGFSLRN